MTELNSTLDAVNNVKTQLLAKLKGIVKSKRGISIMEDLFIEYTDKDGSAADTQVQHLIISIKGELQLFGVNDKDGRAIILNEADIYTDALVEIANHILSETNILSKDNTN